MKPRPTCKICGRNPVKKKHDRPGKVRYKTKCAACDARSRGYKAARGDKCVLCGFVPEHICQLQVDHIDGNHLNNDAANLQTLCANCHALKTFRERDNFKENTAPAARLQLSLSLTLE